MPTGRRKEETTCAVAPLPGYSEEAFAGASTDAGAGWEIRR